VMKFLQISSVELGSFRNCFRVSRSINWLTYAEIGFAFLVLSRFHSKYVTSEDKSSFFHQVEHHKF
jgi:hypothetical protein